ncbi:MAG: hypothetical protein QOK29_5357, partial [Rhodospirillaceae bacterium]|nr:hypothetical protein [Rhodospirillaceae bacterium]
MPDSTRARLTRRLASFTVAAVLGTGLMSPALVTAASPNAGFITNGAAQLSPLVSGVDIKPLLTVGDTIGSYRFESIPDGIAIDPRGHTTFDIYVNHETSKVPFPYNATTQVGLTDFDNAQLSHLVLHRGSGKIMSGDYAIPSSANYQRFCSNFFAGPDQGWSRSLVLTNEEATDFVNRTGTAWPATAGAEQAGLAVAYDPATGAYRSIYGLGRMNHENSVAVPGYNRAVLVTGDDTFTAPASQLYMYTAANADGVWNDTGHLWAFVSSNAAINDYGDLSGAASVGGHFIAVPDAIADGDQTGLETWSNANNVFQFIRIEDLAYDRNDNHIVYFADTGEPRAVADPATGRLRRAAAGTEGPYGNGRIFKMVLNASDPTVVDSLSVLIDADEEQLAALTLLGDRRDRRQRCRVDEDRVGLDVDEERSGAEVLRGVDDARRLPVRRRIGDDSHRRQVAGRQVVLPEPRIGRAGKSVVASRILGDEDAVGRRLDVVGLMECADVAIAAGIRVDEDREAVDDGRITRIQDHLEDAAVAVRALGSGRSSA